MVIVTTMSYDQFSVLMNKREVTLDNDSLVFGQSYDVVYQYLRERLGSDGYVVGIRGRINEATVKLLSRLDSGLIGNRLVLETNVDDRDVLSLGVDALNDVAQILAYGLPEDIVRSELDAAINDQNAHGIQIICVPSIQRKSGIRITSLNREIVVDASDIAFVKLRK